MFIKRRNLPAYSPELSKVAASAMQENMASLVNGGGGLATPALIDFMVFVDGLPRCD
jgi:hypothetical protein